MVTVYVDKVTPRIEYAFQFVFAQRGFDYQFTTDIEAFEQSAWPKIAYSQAELEVAHITAGPLLYSKDIHPVEITYGEYRGEKCLKIDGLLDPVASLFFILTRYEEYTTAKSDAYGRFPFEQSVLDENWIMHAICDRLAEAICHFAQLEISESTEEAPIQPTFDIDNTFAYKLKSGRRRRLSVMKDLMSRNSRRIKERRDVEKGEKDPYDTFDRILEIGVKFPLTSVFWLVGKWARKDRNISVFHPEHQKVIKAVGEKIAVGLHPSFASFQKQAVIQEEKQNLEGVLQTEINLSRQHFLRFTLPQTYRELVNCGFEHEYSMGFAEHVGFRCGTARSHPWFDLEKNQVTELTIHPFVYMDGTLQEYMAVSPEESKEYIADLYREVSRYGGNFTFIWHNETIGDYAHWKGWSQILDFTLNLPHEKK